MAILNIKITDVGTVGISPRVIYIDTNDTIATVTTAGYLNKAVASGYQFSEADMALVSTKTSPNSTTTQVLWLDVSKSGDNWSLVSNSSTTSLPDGDIFVGNSSNVATGVTMSGDVTISNTGVTAIGAGVIVNADISGSAAIDYAKLAALPSAEILVGSAGNVATAVAMSGDVAIDNTGATTIQAGAVESSMVEESLLRHVQVDVDLATFVGSYTASALLIANPGANKKIVLHRATLWINYGGTVLANGGAVHIQYDSTANGAGTKATGTQAAATLIAATADTSFGFSPVDTTLTDATTLDKGLYLATATADFTGGDSSAYKVDLWYSVVDVS